MHKSLVGKPSEWEVTMMEI